MRKLLIIFVATLCLSSIGCTRNNGDIGEWFGTWHLETITTNGVVDANYDGEIFWQFQTDVFCMLELGDYHTQTFHWATWSEHGNTLTLNYDHPRNPDKDDYHKYYPPAQVHMPAAVVDLTIDKMNGHTLVATYRDADNEYTYFLKKQ